MKCPTCKRTDTLQPAEEPTTRMGVEAMERGRRCSLCGGQIELPLRPQA